MSLIEFCFNFQNNIEKYDIDPFQKFTARIGPALARDDGVLIVYLWAFLESTNFIDRPTFMTTCGPKFCHVWFLFFVFTATDFFTLSPVISFNIYYIWRKWLYIFFFYLVNDCYNCVVNFGGLPLYLWTRSKFVAFMWTLRELRYISSQEW